MTRRGATLMEMLTAAAMLVVLMTLCTQMLVSAAAQRRAIEDRQMAVCEAANVMERLAAMPWDHLTPEGVATVQLSAEARARLSEASLAIDLDVPTDQPEAKRVVVVLQWEDRKGHPQRPVRLAAWRWGGLGIGGWGLGVGKRRNLGLEI